MRVVPAHDEAPCRLLRAKEAIARAAGADVELDAGLATRTGTGVLRAGGVAIDPCVEIAAVKIHPYVFATLRGVLRLRVRRGLPGIRIVVQINQADALLPRA